MQVFTEQVAVVTGASSGLGKAITLCLASHGATVCLVGRQLETLQSVAETARRHAVRVAYYRADLSLEEDIHRLAGALREDFGNVDILVHSAGNIFLGPIESAPIEELDLQYRSNV